MGRVIRSVLVVLTVLFVAQLLAVTEIVFWHTLPLDPDKSSIESIVRDFEKENPDIKVKIVIVPAGETDATKLITAVAAGTGPDLVYLDRFTIAQRAAENVLEPMDYYLEKAGITLNKEDFYDFAIKECTFNGRLWALPFDTDVRVLYYNEELLKEAGYTEPPKTIYELIDVAEKLTKEGKGGKYITVGFIPWYAQGWPYTWIYAFEGKVFEEKTGKFVFATDESVLEAYNWLKEWSERFGYEALNAFASMRIGDLDVFRAGKLAMMVDGNWVQAGLRKFAPPSLKWKVSYIPTKSGKPITWAGGWSLAIPKGAKHPVEAARLAYYIATKGQVRYAVDTLHLPTYKPATGPFLEKDPSQKLFVDLLEYAKTRPPVPVGALLWDKLNDAMHSVLTGRKDVEEALMEAQKEVQEAYDKIMEKINKE
jgi:multiple sugar transport system substrate-binding protein